MKPTPLASNRHSFPALAIILAAAISSHAAPVEPGTLQIYDMTTQIGTVARRVVSDEHGRPVQETYYRSKLPGMGKVKDENDIDPYSICLISYDQSGRRVWEGEYTPKWELERTSETLYTGTQRSAIYHRNAAGLLQYEQRTIEGRRPCELAYDETGENLRAIRGPMPSDIDLPSGWGKQVDGLACGVGMNRTAGKLSDFRVYATVRNFTSSPQHMITCLPYQEIQISLRGENGKLVPQATDAIRLRDKELMRMNHGANESRQSLGPYEAACLNGGYDLKDWYTSLPVGTYTLTVKRRGDGPGFPLVSNPVKIEILAD